MASLVTPRSITHDIEESNVATRRRDLRLSKFEGVMAATEGTEGAEVTEAAVVMEVEATVATEGTEEAVAATAAEVMAPGGRGGGGERPRPRPGRRQGLGPPRVAGSRPSRRS